ncbi:hypothetical protein VP01_2650g2 [Puccinia sorghi]|uniref:Uncharacterized protein n=1 Tax=Puccinia sorghi TaxID=27349 RepID=A0A0L6V453_9BASI|nr:hypothetical protein VP01_2650g2 [Puccinia sorghi]
MNFCRRGVGFGQWTNSTNSRWLQVPLTIRPFCPLLDQLSPPVQPIPEETQPYNQLSRNQERRSLPSCLLLFKSRLHLPKALQPPQRKEPKQLLPTSNVKTFAKPSLNLYSLLKNGSPSTVKKQPNQMMLEDYPADFLDTKVSLKSVPPLHLQTPSWLSSFSTNLGTFTLFNNMPRIQTWLNWLHKPIQQSLCPHRQDSHPLHTRSLFNSAMRIAALNIFRQMAIESGYNFMNFNKKTFPRHGSIYLHLKSLRASHILHQFCRQSETAWENARKQFLICHFFSCAMLFINLWWPTNYQNNTEESSRKLLPTVTMSGIPKRIVSPYRPSRIVLAPPAPEATGEVFYQDSQSLQNACPWISTIGLDLTQVAFLPDPKRSLLAKNHPRYDPDKKLSDHQSNKLYLMKEAKRRNTTWYSKTNSDGDGYLEDGEWGNYYKFNKDPDDEDYSSEEGNNGQEDEADEEMNEDNDDYVKYGGHHLTNAKEKEIDEEQIF